MNSPLGEKPGDWIHGEITGLRWPCRVVAVTGPEHVTDESERSLLHCGIEISRYQDPGRALVSIGAEPPPLVLVDTDIRGMAFPDFVRVLVQEARVPVLVGVRSGDVSQDLGFRALEDGALGLVALPATGGRLMRTISQLNLRPPSVAEVLTSGPIILNTHSRKVLVKGESVRLTRTEFDALAYLMAEAPRVVPLEELTIHCAAGRPLHRNGIRIALGRARRKIEAAGIATAIENVRGVGYRMST